ncbi:hypothetical protein RZO31_10110 [Lactococcus lactis]|uniref:Uncharacterized protein n=1 Tax=Lactococcus lactis TaxID=1358 RepID=A0AAE4T0H1_9LACT|nr:hypothetical protein [Lactococcus lactis]MDV2633216.1 hypothetical protein [Lactococcus lactis]
MIKNFTKNIEFIVKYDGSGNISEINLLSRDLLMALKITPSNKYFKELEKKINGI